MPEDNSGRQWAYDTRTSYQKWLETEGIPVIQGYFIEDLKTMEVHPWPRQDAKGVHINLEGCGGSVDSYALEMAPGKATAPEKHMYEEIVYVLEGRGATTIWVDEQHKHTFEWGPGSLFSPPLNTWHQHFNGQGDKPARLWAVTSAPLVIDLYHNSEFVFNSDFVFRDRYDHESDYFSGQGKSLPGRVWESNLIPDVPNFQLTTWKERGAGGANAMFELSNNTMCAHVSQFPVGTYKKAHRHGPGAHVVLLRGIGYSLLWKAGDKDFIKVDWQEGSMFVPPDQYFHQHFNVGTEPARYLAIRWGSQKFRSAVDTDIERIDRGLGQGGSQIEYEEQDPRVQELFERETAKQGAKSLMDEFFTARAKG